jgi:OOP family OmpA-OmpF porin
MRFQKVVLPLFGVAMLSLGLALNGCHADAQAHVGGTDQPPPPTPTPTVADTPPPPAATPPPAPPAPPPVVAVGKAKLDGNKVSIPGELEFASGSAKIASTKGNDDILNTLLYFMQQNTSVSTLRIEGHTDNQGAPAYNLKLSNDRAQAVADWLTSKGVDKGRLHAIGFGLTKPIADNTTADGRAKNRRTEFHVEAISGKPVDDSSGGSSGSGATNPAPSSSASGTAAGATAPPAGTGKGK